MKLTVVTILWLIKEANAENVGDLRLAGNGATSLTGRLEIFLGSNYDWVTVSHRSFDQKAADVACRQLGYIGAESFGPALNSSFGVGDSPWTFLNDSRCIGDELHILRCRWSAEPCANCRHNDDIAIQCSSVPLWATPYEGQIRLVGPYPSKGVVEVHLKSGWGGVCRDNAEVAEAHSICQQLGYTNANAFDFRTYSGIVWLHSFQCKEHHTCFTSCYQYSKVGKDWANDCSTGSLVVSCEFLLEGLYNASFTSCRLEIPTDRTTPSPVLVSTAAAQVTKSITAQNPTTSDAVHSSSSPCPQQTPIIQPFSISMIPLIFPTGSTYANPSEAPFSPSLVPMVPIVQSAYAETSSSVAPFSESFTPQTESTVASLTGSTATVTEPYTTVQTSSVTATSVDPSASSQSLTSDVYSFTAGLSTFTADPSLVVKTFTADPSLVVSTVETQGTVITFTLTASSAPTTSISNAPEVTPSKPLYPQLASSTIPASEQSRIPFSVPVDPTPFSVSIDPTPFSIPLDPTTTDTIITTATVTPPTFVPPFSINDLIAMALGSFGLLVLAAMLIFTAAVICLQCKSCCCRRPRSGVKKEVTYHPGFY